MPENSSATTGADTGTNQTRPSPYPSESEARHRLPIWFPSFLFALVPSHISAMFVRMSDVAFAGVGFHSLAYGMLGICALVIGVVAMHMTKAAPGAYTSAPERAFRLVDFGSILLVGAGMVLAVTLRDVGSTGELGFAGSVTAALLPCTLVEFGVAWQCLRWGSNLAKLKTDDLFKAVLVSSIFGSIVLIPQPVILSCNAMVEILYSIVLCVGSAVCLGMADRIEHVDAEMLYVADNLASFKGVGAAVLAYGFVFDLRGALNYGYEHLGGFTALAAIAICLACYAWIFALHRGFDFYAVLRGILLLFASSAFLSPLLDGWAAGVTSGLMGSVVVLIGVPFNLLCAYISRHSRLHPFIVFGTYWFLYGAPRIVAGMFVTASAGIGYLDGGQMSFLQSLILFILVIAVAIALMTASPGVPPVFGDLFSPKIGLPAKTPSVVDSSIDGIGSTDASGEEASWTPPFAALEEKFEAVARRFGLNDRERATMELICHGRSKAYIADTLYVSESSVKAYTKSLYAKLGVHSKQELIDIVDNQGC